MPTYKANVSDKTRDAIVTSGTEPVGNPNSVTHQINLGNAQMEQTPHQGQPTLVRTPDGRMPFL